MNGANVQTPTLATLRDIARTVPGVRLAIAETKVSDHYARKWDSVNVHVKRIGTVRETGEIALCVFQLGGDSFRDTVRSETVIVPAPSVDLTTTRGVAFRVRRMPSDPAWLLFVRVTEGEPDGSAETLSPAPWPHADQADYLAETLRQRGHVLRVPMVARLRAFLAL